MTEHQRALEGHWEHQTDARGGETTAHREEYYASVPESLLGSILMVTENQRNEPDDWLVDAFKASGLHRNGHQLRALEQLVDAREAFDFSLGAYALLMSERIGSALTDVSIQLNEDGSHRVITRESPPTEHEGISRTTSFLTPAPIRAAKAVVEAAFSRMITKSVDALFSYIKAEKTWDEVKREPWIAFANHLRNAYAHDGRFKFNNNAIFPASFRRFEITKDLHGTTVDGFLPWFHGQQLCATMELYVDGRIDHKLVALKRI